MPTSTHANGQTFAGQIRLLEFLVEKFFDPQIRCANETVSVMMRSGCSGLYSMSGAAAAAEAIFPFVLFFLKSFLTFVS
jgi:hypothetical protein